MNDFLQFIRRFLQRLSIAIRLLGILDDFPEMQ
jgi:hypothetical protein